MAGNEKEWIERSLAGDEEAFAALMHQNEGMVFRHCLSIVHDNEIAQDLTQETFLHAFQKLSTFRQEARFSTWLWRICHNLCLSYLKKHPHDDLEFHEELFTPSPAPADQGESDAFQKRIQEALQALPPKQRIVFEMYVLQRIPQKQIAAQLGIAHATVRSRIHHARKKIKALLQQEASGKSRSA